MYTEERPRGFFLTQFIMRLILVIIFVLLLYWLVPWPKMDAYIDAINPLKDQIFNSNLQTMKDASITYFTTERLPQNVGDKATLTLQQMLDMKLIVPFTDRNGKSCDVTKSYVTIEKKETEYVLKVNLKCGDEEDYILVHVGCYSYCTADICEARKDKKAVVVKPVAKPTNNPTPTYTKYTCKYVNGQYWGKNSTVVSKATYEDQCVPKPTPVVNKEYEYKKETKTDYAAQYSNWSDWTKYDVQKGETIPQSTEYKEYKDLGYQKEQVGTSTEKVVVLKPYQAQITTAKYTVCKGYEYVIERETTVTYTTTETITTENPGYTITTTGGQKLVQVSGDWTTQNKWYSGYNPPTNTTTSRWVPQGVDFEKCGDSCTNHPYVVYRQQTRAATTYDIPGTSTTTPTPGSSSSSSSSSSSTSVSERVLSSGCVAEEREIPVYITRVEPETLSVEKPLYKYVHKAQYRTRTLIAAARTDVKIDYKWSSYNDMNLINMGYSYTGKTRTVGN